MQEADWTRSRCRISQIWLRLWDSPLGDSFPGFPEKEVGCGRRENARFGPSKREILFAGLRPAPRWGSRPRPPPPLAPPSVSEGRRHPVAHAQLHEGERAGGLRRTRY